jgi:AcrR family transcriptional regulator
MKKPASSARKITGRAAVKSQVTDESLVARRREQIVAAATDLFAAQGYDRTTMQDVARKAGISTGLIYQYAQTKEDVLFLSLVSVLESYRREIPEFAGPAGDPIAALWQSVDAYCRIIDRRRNAALLSYRSTMSLPRAQRRLVMQLEVETNELLAVRVRECIAAGLFREIDVDLAVYQLVLHAHGWALKHWRLAKLTTLAAYLDQGFDFFVRAVATPIGLSRYERFREVRSPPRARAARR